jgi:hypothetical protein
MIKYAYGDEKTLARRFLRRLESNGIDAATARLIARSSLNAFIVHLRRGRDKLAYEQLSDARADWLSRNVNGVCPLVEG